MYIVPTSIEYDSISANNGPTTKTVFIWHSDPYSLKLAKFNRNMHNLASVYVRP